MTDVPKRLTFTAWGHLRVQLHGQMIELVPGQEFDVTGRHVEVIWRDVLTEDQRQWIRVNHPDLFEAS